MVVLAMYPNFPKTMGRPLLMIATCLPYARERLGWHKDKHPTTARDSHGAAGALKCLRQCARSQEGLYRTSAGLSVCPSLMDAVCYCLWRDDVSATDGILFPRLPRRCVRYPWEDCPIAVIRPGLDFVMLTPA